MKLGSCHRIVFFGESVRVAKNSEAAAEAGSRDRANVSLT